MKKGAIIDPTGTYRYLLTRIWDENQPPAVFIMLNPSTADAEEDDPTIRRCMNFAKAWGCGGIKVVNVFAYRATDPKKLLEAKDPIGPRNQECVKEAIINAGIVIAAWGAAGPKWKWAYNRIHEAVKEVEVQEIYCLGTTKDGLPRHPLYLKNNTMPKLYIGRESA